MSGEKQLLIAAILSFTASLMHIAIIFGGASWYRVFGAGEKMAQLADQGSLYPAAITFGIAVMLGIWGLYALSGANVIAPLPLRQPALCLITFAYLFRGVAGFVLPFVSDHPAITQNSTLFWMVSSVICCAFGIIHLFGTINTWANLSNGDI